MSSVIAVAVDTYDIANLRDFDEENSVEAVASSTEPSTACPLWFHSQPFTAARRAGLEEEARRRSVWTASGCYHALYDGSIYSRGEIEHWCVAQGYGTFDIFMYIEFLSHEDWYLCDEAALWQSVERTAAEVLSED